MNTYIQLTTSNYNKIAVRPISFVYTAFILIYFLDCISKEFVTRNWKKYANYPSPLCSSTTLNTHQLQWAMRMRSEASRYYESFRYAHMKLKGSAVELLLNYKKKLYPRIRHKQIRGGTGALFIMKVSTNFNENIKGQIEKNYADNNSEHSPIG